jgi:hypothetical protein
MVRAAEPTREGANDKEFVQRAIQAGFRNVSLSTFTQKRHLIPVLANAARQETNRERVEGIANILAQIVLGDDVDAARVARSEWLDLAQGQSPAAMIARSKLKEVDADVRDWLIRMGAGEQRVEQLYPGPMIVHVSAKELDPADLPKLRMLRSPRSRNNAKQELGGSISMLCLHATSVKDEHLRYLSGLRSIEFIDLSGTRVTGEGFRDLDLPILRGIRLDDCPVTDATVRRIDIPSLEALYLGNTTITGIGLGAMRTAKIRQLHLYRTSVTASDLAHLKRFELLLTLNLEGRIIDREAIGHLSKCMNLRWISLHSDLPKGVTLEEVRKSLPNCNIQIVNAVSSERSKAPTGLK